MQKLPIGTDDFGEIRKNNKHYIDKTLLIKDFIENGDEVTLITRPRRFGKTLNMTMLREFFDITKDSRDIFEGLAIMDTEYAGQINTRPVIYLSLKNCADRTPRGLLEEIGEVILAEYWRYHKIIESEADRTEKTYFRFFEVYEYLLNKNIRETALKSSIMLLTQTLHEYYKTKPLLLIDEYDTPVLCAEEHGFRDDLKLFFSGLFGSALKGNESLHQALLSGIQRIAKESIFSQLNNVRVYTVVDRKYSQYFGFTEPEVKTLLECHGLKLDEEVKNKYDGYLFGNFEIYNPWSVLCYADTGELGNYWINTSTNHLIHKSIAETAQPFRDKFEQLIKNNEVTVGVDLQCSFAEMQNAGTLWGLLVNSGYITVVSVEIADILMRVRIPNGEVGYELSKILLGADNAAVGGLHLMFNYLIRKDTDRFLEIYRDIVLSCTSYYDAKENAYHMLFLGMCLTLRNIYKVESNIEAGYGRSDITMTSKTKGNPHIIVEFKEGEDINALKGEALQQILDKKYYAKLDGEILCIGLAHNKKQCATESVLISNRAV